MVKDHSDSEREETRCRHMGYSFRLAAKVLLYASSHRQYNTYHSLLLHQSWSTGWNDYSGDVIYDLYCKRSTPDNPFCDPNGTKDLTQPIEREKKKKQPKNTRTRETSARNEFMSWSLIGGWSRTSVKYFSTSFL